MANTPKNAAKRVQNPTSLNAAHATSPTLSAARSLAHAPSVPQRASSRWLTSTPPNPQLDPQSPRRRRRLLSCAPRGHR
eukprot:6931080-Prymnesium_polylepis.1